MAVATFRFYEELNDFLPPHRRKQDLVLKFDPHAPVRHLMETFGVPHTEVEIILVNGVSVDLDHRIEDGDRVSLYPMFESLDVSPLLRLRERPMRQPQFVADAHLGRLARYLRMLGFDTLFRNDWGDQELAHISAREQRILLTGDRALLMHRLITHGCHVCSQSPRRQLEQLIRRLDLCRSIHPFTRCMRCNGRLAAVAKGDVLAQLPGHVRLTHDEFRCCDSCGQLFWNGSHYQRMRVLIVAICPDFMEYGSGQ